MGSGLNGTALSPDTNDFINGRDKRRACPTIGLSRGSRCSHDLSLLIM